MASDDRVHQRSTENWHFLIALLVRLSMSCSRAALCHHALLEPHEVGVMQEHADMTLASHVHLRSLYPCAGQHAPPRYWQAFGPSALVPKQLIPSHTQARLTFSPVAYLTLNVLCRSKADKVGSVST